MKFKRISRMKGEVTIPGDKSISHRSVMLGSLARGTTRISHFLPGADCLSTISCFRSMGVVIEQKDDFVTVHGNGLRGLKKPDRVLDCGNSGTTTRIIAGILSGQSFDVTLTGDDSIKKRPMKRVMEPLSQMGANILSLKGNGCAPLSICGQPLHGIHYHTPVASAQVKSAILMAGLYADGITKVTEPALTRNHTELMLRHFGAQVETEGTVASVSTVKELYGTEITVPGDISSAAYFIAAGLLVPDSEILIKQVGINPTRDGILRVCKAMGADITLLNVSSGSGEPAADLLVKTSTLHGTVIEGEIIPTLIDELPIIAVMACLADGETLIRDAAELKVKESNRLDVMVNSLKAMGADITGTEDGMIIRGGKPLNGTVIDSLLDHRIAMTFAIAGLCADGETEILQADCVNISYPQFYQDVNRLIQSL